MKRLTLSLDEDLLKRLRRDAAERGMTLSEFVSDVLHQAIDRGVHRGRFRLRLQGWQAELRPGVDILDRDRLFDVTRRR